VTDSGAPRRAKTIDRRLYCSTCSIRIDEEPLTFTV